MSAFNLPSLPSSKEYDGKMTPEQKAIMKCLESGELTSENIDSLKKSIAFYKEAFSKLKEINLSNLREDEAEELKSYLNQVFNFKIFVFNDLHFNFLFRVSIVHPDFLEKGKVRNPKYLRNPPIELVKEKGLYNRANTSDKTVFYASFYENVALRETKPQVGDRIIISTWKNTTGKPFNSFPITNSTVDNDGIRKATEAFEETKKYNNPYFAEIMDLILGFLAEEFVKEVKTTNPKRYEYLFSAYFADMVFSPFNEDDPTPRCDFIIYPSVAWQHKHENVAVIPESVDSKLKLVRTEEYEVTETFYEKELGLKDSPAKLNLLRQADWIEEDNIIWEDD